MIFYKKECIMPALNEKTLELNFSSFKGTGMKKETLYPENCLNFRAEGGNLIGGWGSKKVFESNPYEGYEVRSAHLYDDGTGNGKIIFIGPGNVFEFSLQPPEDGSAPAVSSAFRRSFSKPPKVFRYVDGEGTLFLIFCFLEGVFVYDGFDFYYMQNSPAAWTGCAYYDRAFLVSLVSPYRIYFSEPLNHAEWKVNYSSAGYLDLSPEHGAIHALFPCGKALYALRERGLTLIRAEGESFNFTATPVPAAFGNVFVDSVQAVGNRLTFLTSDGLYAFDGNAVKKIAQNLTVGANFAAEPDCRVCAYGAYYVLNYKTSAGERRTLFLDPATEEGWLSDLDVSAPASDGVNCYFSDGGVLSAFTRESTRANGPLIKVWESGYTRLNLGVGRKILRGVTVFGKGNFKLTVRGTRGSDEKVFSFFLDGEKTVRPLVRSNGFSFRLESDDENCTLEKLSVTVDLLKEEKAK